MSEFEARRLVVSHTHRVPGSAAQVFPLLCPIREYDWLEPWACEMVYSRSGVAELDAVCTTDFADRGHGVWTCSRYDPPGRIEYVVHWSTQVVDHLQIVLEQDEEGGTSLTWTRTFTGLDEAGNRHIDEHVAPHAEIQLHVAGRVLAHYVETGEMLPISAAIAGAHG
jgi:hypothetical protein